MKRIVICCDGTWNTPDKTSDGVPVPTNVVKMALSVKPSDNAGTEQLVYYDVGIGTSGSWLKRLYDGATGAGLTRNIREAYTFLVDNYTIGDELFLLGFSRGAFTVRSLAGLIRKCGILRRNAHEMVTAAIQLYRSRSAASHPREKEATLFRRTYSLAEKIPIKFIGVWDTVGALGNPLLLNGILSRRLRFHDTDLSSTVSFAYQALAVDEKRRNFRPTLWNLQAHSKEQTLEQVWFPGTHSDIGGGNPLTGLSDIALSWMVEKVTSCGLELEIPGLQADAMLPIRESWKGFYKLLPRFYRPITLCDQDGKPTCETLDSSIRNKLSKQPSYRPMNVVEHLPEYGRQA